MIRHFVRPSLALIVALLATPVAAAQTAAQEAAMVRIPQAAEPPTLDAVLSGRMAEQAAVVTGFRQRQPGDGDPASQHTTAYVSYDTRNLYVGFVCTDADPSLVRAQLSKRESVFDDDRVTVALDTFHDRRRAYLFVVNPLGIQADGITTEGQGDDYSFDTLWHSAGRLTPTGYAVLMTIPFRSLRFETADAQTWGIALSRTIPRNNEHSWWPRITTQISGFANQFAAAEGLSRVSPGRNIQLIPYAAFANARFLDSGRADYATDAEPRVGLDTKVVVKDAITIDAAINPDFSQVESDSPQVTVNQRFEVFFPEKRPFFIENAGLFQTPGESLFFSRRIADPQFGGRVTGKLGGWTLAGLVIDDRAAGARLAETDPAHGARAAIGVVRAEREFGQQSNVGMMVTSRDFGPSSNRVAAIDTRLKLNRNWSFTGQAVASETTLVDGTRLSGPAFNASLTRSSRAVFYQLFYSDRDPQYRAQLGFVPRTDMRDLTQFVTYRWFPKSGPFVSFGPNSFVNANWNHAGELQDWIVRFPWSIEMKGETFFFVRRQESSERFNGIEFRQHENLIQGGTSYWKWLSVSGSVATAIRPNFYPAAGVAPFAGDALEGSLSVVVRPQPQLRVEGVYLYSRLSDTRRPDATRVHVFDNHIARSRLDYQFNREMSLRAIVDYNGVLANPALVRFERTKSVTGDLLFTYLLNPGTAVYVGYTDGYENLLLTRGVPESMQRAGSPGTSIGRQIFVKTSYLFRF